MSADPFSHYLLNPLFSILPFTNTYFLYYTFFHHLSTYPTLTFNIPTPSVPYIPYTPLYSTTSFLFNPHSYLLYPLFLIYPYHNITHIFITFQLIQPIFQHFLYHQSHHPQLTHFSHNTSPNNTFLSITYQPPLSSSATLLSTSILLSPTISYTTLLPTTHFSITIQRPLSSSPISLSPTRTESVALGMFCMLHHLQ